MFICENGILKMDINRVLCMIINSRLGPTAVHHAPWGSHSHGVGREDFFGTGWLPDIHRQDGTPHILAPKYLFRMSEILAWSTSPSTAV